MFGSFPISHNVIEQDLLSNGDVLAQEVVAYPKIGKHILQICKAVIYDVAKNESKTKFTSKISNMLY